MCFQRLILLFSVLTVALTLDTLTTAQEGGRTAKWENGALTMSASTTLATNAKGYKTNKKEIYIGFDAQAHKESDSWHQNSYEVGGLLGEHAKFESKVPSFYLEVPKFYKKFTGNDIADRYKDSSSEIPILDALGDQGWELAAVTLDRIEEPGHLIRVTRTFHFKRPKK